VGLAASFLGPAQEGVHRWLKLGPLHINVAMLLLPAAVVALAVLGRNRRWPWGVAFIALALLLLQPDASQATALGACLGLLAAFAAGPGAVRGALVVAAGVLAGLSWLRPDPLGPVAEVEEVIGLAYAVSPLAAGLALISLAAVAAAPGFAARSAPPVQRLAGWALSLCFLLWMTMPLLGVFPVPLVGIGMSPILGAWLGVGLLAALLRSPAHGVGSTGPSDMRSGK
jgi:cell division protein FtsW (lipid II flippase)